MDDGLRHHGVSGKRPLFLLVFLLLACSDQLKAETSSPSNADSNSSTSDWSTKLSSSTSSSTASSLSTLYSLSSSDFSSSRSSPLDSTSSSSSTSNSKSSWSGTSSSSSSSQSSSSSSSTSDSQLSLSSFSGISSQSSSSPQSSSSSSSSSSSFLSSTSDSKSSLSEASSSSSSSQSSSSSSSTSDSQLSLSSLSGISSQSSSSPRSSSLSSSSSSWFLSSTSDSQSSLSEASSPSSSPQSSSSSSSTSDSQLSLSSWSGTSSSSSSPQSSSSLSSTSDSSSSSSSPTDSQTSFSSSPSSSSSSASDSSSFWSSSFHDEKPSSRSSRSSSFSISSLSLSSSSLSSPSSAWSSASDYQNHVYDYACSWATRVISTEPEAIVGSGGKNSLIGPPDAYPCYTSVPIQMPSFAYIIFEIPEELFVRRVAIYMPRGIESLEYIMAYDYDADEFEFVWETYEKIVLECSTGILAAEVDFHEFPTDTIALWFNGDWSDDGIEVDAVQVYGTRSSPSNVRIVEGGSLTKGRIEVFDPVEWNWGTVCRSGELNDRTGKLLAHQLGQCDFDRFGGDGEFPASMYSAIVNNPQCFSSDDNILDCLESGGSCDITDVGIVFTHSSLELCEGTVVEDSESQCTCHKTKTVAYSNICLGYAKVCSPSVISVSGDIDAHLYTGPNDNIVESHEETTTGEFTSPTSEGKTTAEETTFAETTPEETTVGEVSSEATTLPETTAGETTLPETTAGETTLHETTAGETTLPETTAGETTLPETTAGETTLPETTAGESTCDEVTVGETTLGEVTVAETTLGEVTVEETTLGEITSEEMTLGEVPVEETTLAGVSVGETTEREVIVGETTIDEFTVELTTLVNPVSGENTATELPFSEETVWQGTDVTILSDKVPTSEVPSVWSDDGSSVLPLVSNDGVESDMQLATTKHCASLDCPRHLQYSDRAELVDLRNASISSSSSKSNHAAESAFLQQLIPTLLDFEYLIDNDFLRNYQGFTGWRPASDDTKPPYIRVDFEMTVTVQGLVVLGGQGSGAQHVMSLKVAYADTREFAWKYYQEGGTTQSLDFELDYSNGYARIMFDRWLEAKRLILLPQTWHEEIWMRIFVLGARYIGGPVPLGMESGEIADAQISASSFLGVGHGPEEGRLNGPSAWCAGLEDSDPWIKIDLLTRAHIQKIAVQGLVNASVDDPGVSGSYPDEIRMTSSLIDGFYTYVDLEQQGNSASSAGDIQEFYTSWDPVARYIRIKIKSSSTAYSCLRVEIYGYMNFELWPDFDGIDFDDHIDYGTSDDIHLECSCLKSPPIENFKEDYYFFLSGSEIVDSYCPGQNWHGDTSAVTPSSNWPEQTSGLSPVYSSATTESIFTDIFSVEISSPALTSPSSSWLCPGMTPDTTFTSTIIFREVLAIRKGCVRLNYFLRGDDRTSWTLFMRVLTELDDGTWTHSDEVVASAHGSPGGSSGEWTEFYIDYEFRENYQLVAVFTIIADGYSMVAFGPDSFQLVSDSFIDAKENKLGMMSLKIVDHQISASSELSVSTPATSARLYDGTGWCPSENDTDSWIQVDMEKVILLNGIMLQGRKDSNDWVTEYYIRVSDDEQTWFYYDDMNTPTIFEGSWSFSLVTLQSLPDPMYCRFIRIYPVGNNTYPCMRFELTGFRAGNAVTTTPVSTTETTTSLTTPQAITTTPTNAVTSNSFTNATSSSTVSVSTVQEDSPTTHGQVQNLMPTRSSNVTSTSSEASSTANSLPNNPMNNDNGFNTPGSNATTMAVPTSLDPTTANWTSMGGGKTSNLPPNMITGSEEMTAEPQAEIPSQIVHATGVDDVFNAVTNPNITVSFETASAALNVVDNLTHQSSGPLNKEDIKSIKGTLTAVSSHAASTKETAQTFLDVVGSILVPNDTLTDPEAISTENSTSLKKHASSIMELVESFATDAAKNLLSPAKKKVVIQNDDLVLQLTKISPEDIANTTDPVSVSVNSSTNELHFPSSVFKGKNVTISAVVFNNLHLTTSSQLGGLGGNNTATSVGSKIMSIQVEATDGSNITFSADEPFELVLELHKDANTSNTQSLCVFWEFLEDEESGGVWSTVGCHRNQTNGSQITCHCDHLTNFAILLQVNPNPVVLSLAHRVTLDMLTYIGLALSVAALVCTLTTFVLLKLMKSQRTIIHTNLCIALLSAQLLYLIGIERTASTELCTTIAVLLHYLYTSTFSWMLMEGVYILMQSRSAYGKGGKTWMYMLAGWGSPVVIIAVSLGIRLDGYGTDDYCWLSVENGFMWAFATPVLAVLAMNTIVLIMVIRVFMALKANLDKTEAERLRAGVRAVLLLQPLLGFTWIFGLLAAYDASLFFAYMFVIFNSLQGVFIFIVNCLMNEEVKKAFRTKYHRSRGRRRRSTHTTQISTTDTSVAFKTTRAFMDRSRATSKSSKGSSVAEGLAIKLRSTKVQPLSDDKASTKM